MFQFSSAYKIYVDTILQSTKCATVLCIKNNLYPLIEKYLIAKKCYPSPEPSASHNLFAGGGRVLPQC